MTVIAPGAIMIHKQVREFDSMGEDNENNQIKTLEQQTEKGVEINVRNRNKSAGV